MLRLLSSPFTGRESQGDSGPSANHCCWEKIDTTIGLSITRTSIPQWVVETGRIRNRDDEIIVFAANSNQAGVIQSVVYIHEAHSAYFSDRGRSFQRDRGRCFRLIVDAQGCAQARN